MPLKCLLQEMCSISGTGCKNDIYSDNNGNNYDDNNNRINTHSFGQRDAEGSFLFYKTPLFYRVAPAHSCLISRLLMLWISGPRHVIWVEWVMSNFPKSRAWEKDFDAGSLCRMWSRKREWRDWDRMTREKEELTKECILRSLALVYF